MNTWKCAESCMGSRISCEIKLVHDNTPDKCMTNGEAVLWTRQNTSSNKEYTEPKGSANQQAEVIEKQQKEIERLIEKIKKLEEEKRELLKDFCGYALHKRNFDLSYILDSFLSTQAES